MRKRNYTVTIRMNKAEYDLLQNKVKESDKQWNRNLKKRKKFVKKKMQFWIQ